MQTRRFNIRETAQLADHVQTLGLFFRRKLEIVERLIRIAKRSESDFVPKSIDQRQHELRTLPDEVLHLVENDMLNVFQHRQISVFISQKPNSTFDSCVEVAFWILTRIDDHPVGKRVESTNLGLRQYPCFQSTTNSGYCCSGKTQNEHFCRQR